MDPVSLVFYAAVCGILSLVAPKLGGFAPRLGVGALVGVIAASLLPVVKGMMAGAY